MILSDFLSLSTKLGFTWLRLRQPIVWDSVNLLTQNHRSYTNVLAAAYKPNFPKCMHIFTFTISINHRGLRNKSIFHLIFTKLHAAYSMSISFFHTGFKAITFFTAILTRRMHIYAFSFSIFHHPFRVN